MRAVQNYVEHKQRQSRYYGWKWGIVLRVIIVTCVLLLNVLIIAIVARKRHGRGVVTLVAGSENKGFTHKTGVIACPDASFQVPGA